MSRSEEVDGLSGGKEEEQILKERIGNGSDARPIAEIAADLEFSKKSFRR